MSTGTFGSGHDAQTAAAGPAAVVAAVAVGAGAELPANPNARLLFRYLGGDEWIEYRAILAVFADTYFTDFSPDEVHARLGCTHSARLSEEVVGERLESLRRWGNLEASSDVGRPSSIDDYYRRRHRYLITPAGQQVFDLVERVLASADEVADPAAGRLHDLHRHLSTLAEHAPARFADLTNDDATAAVRAVFDTHERFADELTGFFRHLGQWQSRYDLGPAQVRQLAEVIVGYIGERLQEIDRMRRPIARCIETVIDRLDDLLERLDTGLAGRMHQAGLADGISVRRVRGTSAEDWRLLRAWFADAPRRPARLTQLTEQALGAVRTLTANLSRLSRLGVLTSSRRADFLRLAGFFDGAQSVQHAHEIAAAAFGLGACRHASFPAADIDDPVPTTTTWAQAPSAVVPVSLRKRGERPPVTGNVTPLPDRRREQQHIRERLARERVERAAAAADLLSAAEADDCVDGAELSAGAFEMLRDLLGSASHGPRDARGVRVAVADGVRCEVQHALGSATEVSGPHGRLTFHDATVTVVAAGRSTATARGANSPTPPEATAA